MDQTCLILVVTWDDIDRGLRGIIRVSALPNCSRVSSNSGMPLDIGQVNLPGLVLQAVHKPPCLFDF